MNRPLALLVALALGACTTGADSVTVSNIDIETIYTRGMLQWVTAGRDTPVTVLGNPTDAPDEAWERAVVDGLNASGWVPGTRFTTEPDGSERGNFHFVVASGTASALRPAEACLGAPAPGHAPSWGGSGHILFAFCQEGRAIASARATMAPLATPAAVQLPIALDLLMRRSLPLRNPQHMDNRDSVLLP